MTKFQIITVAVFVVFIVAGVALFATFKGSSTATDQLPAIQIWGTFPQSVVNELVQQINLTRSTPIVVNYYQDPEENFDKDFIAALARGKGPDAILVPQEMISRYADKIVQIPSNVLSQRDFMNAYVSQAQLYLTSTGSMALPFSIDPLVMYWNRDIFTNAGIATPPRYWSDFTPVVGRIDVKDVNSNIRRSAIALGEFSNITHAREILSALLMQSGNPITAKNANGVVSTLGDGAYQGSQTSLPAISFFTQFSNPQNPLYSWNRGQPSSQSWFLSGNLATYFGFASELYDLRAKNPNLDFDVAPFPQAKTGQNRITYGKMYGFSLVRTSLNQAATYSILQMLTSPPVLSYMSKATYLPPVRRDMIATGSTDPYLAIFYDSALISRSWLDIDAVASNQIFQNMIESITSGSANAQSAINTADGKLNLLLQSQ